MFRSHRLGCIFSFVLFVNYSSLIEKYLSRKIDVFVGVHIRRTDYFNHLKNTYLIEPVKLDYFYRAMDFYQVKFSPIFFSRRLPEPNIVIILHEYMALRSTYNQLFDYSTSVLKSLLNMLMNWACF